MRGRTWGKGGRERGCIVVVGPRRKWWDRLGGVIDGRACSAGVLRMMDRILMKRKKRRCRRTTRMVTKMMRGQRKGRRMRMRMRKMQKNSL